MRLRPQVDRAFFIALGLVVLFRLAAFEETVVVLTTRDFVELNPYVQLNPAYFLLTLPYFVAGLVALSLVRDKQVRILGYVFLVDLVFADLFFDLMALLASSFQVITQAEVDSITWGAVILVMFAAAITQVLEAEKRSTGAAMSGPATR